MACPFRVWIWLYLLHYTVTGGSYDIGKDDNSEEILEYIGEDGWRKVGVMKNGRSYHGISLVKYEDFEDYCGEDEDDWISSGEDE